MGVCRECKILNCLREQSTEKINSASKNIGKRLGPFNLNKLLEKLLRADLRTQEEEVFFVQDFLKI